MIERRNDEWTAVSVEYALFLADTRGMLAGLRFSTSMNLPPEVLERLLERRGARRVAEDRRGPSRADDQAIDAGAPKVRNE